MHRFTRTTQLICFVLNVLVNVTWKWTWKKCLLIELPNPSVWVHCPQVQGQDQVQVLSFRVQVQLNVVSSTEVQDWSLHFGHMSAPTYKWLCAGVIYQPGEPLLLQSLGNTFVLRCIDGQYIDGNDRLVSAAIYRSVHLLILSSAGHLHLHR